MEMANNSLVTMENAVFHVMILTDVISAMI